LSADREDRAHPADRSTKKKKPLTSWTRKLERMTQFILRGRKVQLRGALEEGAGVYAGGVARWQELQQEGRVHGDGKLVQQDERKHVGRLRDMQVRALGRAVQQGERDDGIGGECELAEEVGDTEAVQGGWVVGLGAAGEAVERVGRVAEGLVVAR
jgi:hypothetical protein